ncbi:hypothetical protein NPIL_395111 [Nephila pilipes]|uniref:Uncharacterized protein n=1 Tax=Nephila pilipes TaxID=299642 RepID=A0A8X6Q0Z9_NEPPI|nr:hypothetical protein NPIL_395111 [Nephila pilipes]
MESENESLQDHVMSSNASSSRASTPSIPEHFHSACLRRKLIEQELKTYTDSIDHTEILMKNLERQGLLDHPIYTNHRTMIHGLRRQRRIWWAYASSCCARKMSSLCSSILLVSQTSLVCMAGGEAERGGVDLGEAGRQDFTNPSHLTYSKL